MVLITTGAMQREFLVWTSILKGPSLLESSESHSALYRFADKNNARHLCIRQDLRHHLTTHLGFGCTRLLYAEIER